MRQISRLIAPALLGLGLGCTESIDAELRAACLSLCQSLNCADGVNVTRCARELVHRQHEADRRSDDCGATYRVMIECAAAIVGCTETAEWETRRGFGEEFPYPCREETEDFLAACPDLWFEKK